MSYNNTTVVNINQGNNGAIKELNEVKTAKNSKCCCGKCLKYVAFPVFVAYLFSDVVYNKLSNIKNMVRCYDLKGFSNDISKLFTNDTINSLMTNYSSPDSQAALTQFFDAYKKIEGKYPFINLKRSDIEKTLAFVNGILLNFTAVEKISKTCEKYFKNTTELIQEKAPKYIDKYKKYFKKGKETVNNITDDVEEFNTKAVKYQNYLQASSKAIDNIYTNLTTLQQFPDKFKDGNVDALIPHVKKVIDNLTNSLKDVHNITINVQNDLVTDKNEIDVYIKELSDNVQNITANLQQDAKNDIQEIKNLTTNIKQSGEDILRESEKLLEMIKNDTANREAIFENAKKNIKAISALDYEGDKCRTFQCKSNSPYCIKGMNAKAIAKATFHGMDSLKPSDKLKID